jgi:hypothetical protein
VFSRAHRAARGVAGRDARKFAKRAPTVAPTRPPLTIPLASPPPQPYLVQEKLLRFCGAHKVAVTAFRPLGAGSYVELSMAAPADSALVDPVIVGIAARPSAA